MPSAFVTSVYRLAGLERPDRWVEPSHADWAAGLEAGRVSSVSGDGGAARLGATELETASAAAAAASDPPERVRGRASPARIKLRVENERTLEIKIVYRLGGPEKGSGGGRGGSLLRRGGGPSPPPRANTYRVDVYLFCPSELEPADPTSSFYANLFVVIRLHTPHVDLADLGAAGAALGKAPSALTAGTSHGGSTSLAVATSLLFALARSFGDMHASSSAASAARDRAASLGWADPRRRTARKACLAADAARAARADDAVQLMRLLACIFRAAVRRATGAAADAALAVVEGRGGGDPAAAKAAARAGIDLVEQACGALEALATACDPCRADVTGAIPAFVREAAGLVEEHTILEAERALLKLLVDLEGRPLLPPPTAAGPGGPDASQLVMRIPGGGAVGGSILPLPPPPHPTPAGWAGRFPHLDAVRESAAAARRRSSGGGVTGAASRGWTARSGMEGDDSRTTAHSGATTPLGSSPPPGPIPLPPQPPVDVEAYGGELRQRRATTTAATTVRMGSRSPPTVRPAASSFGSLGRRPSLEMVVVPPTALGAARPAMQPSTPGPVPPTTPAVAEDLEAARALLREAVAGLEAARLRRGFTESIMRDGPPEVNESYTNRRQALKKHARAAISLTPRTKPPPTWLQDAVGMAVAAVAMAFATSTVWLAQR